MALTSCATIEMEGNVMDRQENQPLPSPAEHDAEVLFGPNVTTVDEGGALRPAKDHEIAEINASAVNRR